tara:strand:- start:30 stop:1010 length:981 start_codon:yes stop_codon:yes gene_type:complete
VSYLKVTEEWKTSEMEYNSEQTGLCNRIIFWEVAYLFNHINNFKFTILLEKLYWSELNYLSMPNTKGVDEYKEDFWNGDKTLNFEMLLDDETFKLNTEINWVLYQQHFIEYYDYFFKYIKKFSFNRPLQLIDIKNDVLKNTIIEKLDGVVGIHVRKGDAGTPEETINFEEIRNKLKDKSLSDSEREKLEKESLTCGQGGRWYETFKDERYLKIMDDIVKVKPNQKFYISTNGDKEQLKVFYDNFDILDYSTILNNIKNVDESKNYLDYELNKNCLRNVVDLFSLSYSKFLILHPESTWSKFAKWYKGVPSINVSDEFDIYNYRSLL